MGTPWQSLRKLRPENLYQKSQKAALENFRAAMFTIPSPGAKSVVLKNKALLPIFNKGPDGKGPKGDRGDCPVDHGFLS
jgi:hypothetical protein